VIVLGCTGMFGVAAQLRERLAAKGFGVHVIEPNGAAVTWLESCVRLGLTPSRTIYMPPLAKGRSA
jgi:allantoin racemase